MTPLTAADAVRNTLRQLGARAANLLTGGVHELRRLELDRLLRELAEFRVGLNRVTRQRDQALDTAQTAFGERDAARSNLVDVGRLLADRGLLSPELTRHHGQVWPAVNAALGPDPTGHPAKLAEHLADTLRTWRDRGGKPWLVDVECDEISWVTAAAAVDFFTKAPEAATSGSTS